MANTDVHDSVAVTTALLIPPLLYVTLDDSFTIAYSVSAFVGLLMPLIGSPDLDHDRSVIAKRWLLKPLIWYWRVYGRLFKHRGYAHWPIFGTLTRAIWILPIVLAGLVYIPDFTLLWLCFWILGDCIHIWVDRA